MLIKKSWCGCQEHEKWKEGIKIGWYKILCCKHAPEKCKDKSCTRCYKIGEK